MRTVNRVLLLVALFFGLFASPSRAAENDDPRQGRVPLPAQGGWEAQLCLDRGKVGVWTVKAFPILDAVGTKELVALDDEGKLHILVPYSGRWSGPTVLEDRRWLGGLCFGDVDPRVPGSELYTGGARGNLWQVLAHAHGAVETRLVANLEGREIHTMVVADVDPRSAGNEIVMFTWPGGLYVVRNDGTRLEIEKLQNLTARYRDALVLPPARASGPVRIATVSRGGVLAILTFEQGKAHFEEVLRVQGGMGRVARRTAKPGAPEVLYTVCDDGCVYRVEQSGSSWNHELIYAGPEGMRGVVSGAFDTDPTRETIAVFGYSARVELLTRHEDGWSPQTIFEARDKGHWLCTAEVDTRNSTPEIFCCGYGGRLVMLSRPPGYGRPGVAAVRPRAAAMPPLRLGFAGIPRKDGRVHPLQYQGGFRLKTMIYETLVGLDEDGRIVPRLAQSFESADDDRRWVFTLRDGAQFHDGRPCDAHAVAAWFGSWLGGKEHAWLRMNRIVKRVEALDSKRVAFELTESFPLPQELTSVNPCAIATTDGRSIGTGPWRLEHYDPLDGATLRRVADGTRLELKYLHGGDHVSRSHIEAMASGAVDAVADGWVPHLPREAALALAREDDTVELVRAPGSRTALLVCNKKRGALADAALRRRLAAALDPKRLIEYTQAGQARLARGLFGALPNTYAPRSPTSDSPEPVSGTLVLPVYENDPDRLRLAQGVARQALQAGIRIDVVALERSVYQAAMNEGDWDVMLSGTHGRPYDPWTWLASRADRPAWMDEAVASARAAPARERRAALAAIEERIANDARWIPLFVPHRIGLVRPTRMTLRFGATPYEIEVLPAD